MSDSGTEPGGGARARRDETPAERLDRNWNELLQELRVAQTGAQILAAFLLTVPFQQRFSELSHGQVVLYLICVALAALTTGLLVAPVAWHRSAFRKGRKAGLVTLASLAARLGLFSLSTVISGSLALVFWVSADGRQAVYAGAAALAVLVGGWFVVPMVAFRRTDS